MPAPRAPEPPTPRSADALDATPAFLRPRRSEAPQETIPPAGEVPGAPDPAIARRAAPPEGSRTGALASAAAGAPVDPASLPFATIPPRIVARAVGLLVVGWIVLALARQVGDAAAASERVDAMRRANSELRTELGALQGELSTVSDQHYVDLQARAHGLGASGEIPFALAANVPSLPPDAPGSASVRLGAAAERRTPLESWLSILFGPGG